MAVIQPRPAHILYQCAKFGDDRTSFNVIFGEYKIIMNIESERYEYIYILY